jgi:hypothetical protein
MKVIDKLIEQWHGDMDCKTKVHEYVGISLAEYDDFMNGGQIPARLPRLSENFNEKIHGDPSNPGLVKPAKREVLEVTRDVVTFFEHGRISLEDHDFKTREAALKVCLPCCIFLSISPSLLGAGLIDDFAIHHPLSVWVPQLTVDKFHPSIAAEIPLIAEKTNSAIRAATEKTLQNFQDLLQVLPTPEDLIPSLPLGIYVEFFYRCSLDKMGAMLLNMGSTPGAGVDQVRYAFAEILASALTSQQTFSSLRFQLSLRTIFSLSWCGARLKRSRRISSRPALWRFSSQELHQRQKPGGTSCLVTEGNLPPLPSRTR